MCVEAYYSKELGATGDVVPFTLEPIILDLEGGCYIGNIHQVALLYLVAGKCGFGSRGGSG